MSCPRYCCCCFSKDDATKHYAHIEYRRLNTPPQPEVVAEVPEFQKVPMKKLFELPQLQMEYGIQPDFCADEVITQQPVRKHAHHELHRSVSQSMEDSCPTVRKFKPSLAGIRYLSTADIDSERTHGSWMPNDLEMEASPSLDKETILGPRLTFSLYYDIQRCILTLTLFKGHDLPAKDRRGTSDPFVVMYLDPSREEVFQSRIVYKTLNPSFNEHFEFKNVLPNDVRCQTMVFNVYDHDKYSKNDFIGASMLPLKDADLYGATMTIAIDETAVEARVWILYCGDSYIMWGYFPGGRLLD